MLLFSDMVGALVTIAFLILLPVTCQVVADAHCARLERARRDDEDAEHNEEES